MPANLSLIVNLILLVVVVIAISYLMKTRRQHSVSEKQLDSDMRTQPSLGAVGNASVDEIIAVRKLTADFDEEDNIVPEEPRVENGSKMNKEKLSDQMIMMFLLAKDQHQFAGYELLQTVLAAGLRFGEGDLFHRHQHPNGQGPVIFSLAAATADGIFDIQNMGAFNARGLCLFMQISGNATIDKERFNILYETARQLSEGLDAHLLDEHRRPLTKESLMRYQRILGDSLACEES